MGMYRCRKSKFVEDSTRGKGKNDADKLIKVLTTFQ